MTTMTEPRVLRDYQREAVEAVVSAWAADTRRVGVVAATGLGKSTIIAALACKAADMGLRVVMIAHRAELLAQMADTVAAVDPGREPVGIVKAERDEAHAQIVAASIQTLTGAHRREALGRRDVILYDECFVAGTLVDGRPIETLRAGDTVTAWDETAGVRTQRQVVRTMKSRPTSLVEVTLSDGQRFVCTPGHPFLTDNGWLPAAALSHGVRLHHVETHGPDRITPAVHRMREPGGYEHEVPQGQVPGAGAGVLLSGVFGYVSGAAVLGDDGAHEPQVRLGAHDGAEPDARPGGAGEGSRSAQGIGARPATTGRERDPGTRTTTTPGGVSGVAHGGAGEARGRGTSVALLPRHRASLDEGQRGGGRAQPRHGRATLLGRETGPEDASVRVAGVQVLEPGSDGTYGGMCPDGHVYNLEVDTDHTYTVGDGVVVHNCHHLGAESWHAALEDMGLYAGAFMCGFTATMTRDSGVALGEIMERVVFERDLRWAVDAGHLVRPEGLTVELPDLRLDRITSVAGDYHQGELAEVMEASTDTVVSAITRYAAGRRPIVFAAGVDAAHALAAALTTVGLPAMAVTGTTSPEDRAAVYAAFRSGAVRALVTVQVLTEGADFPMCDAAVIARPTRSQVLYSQMVGRALRLHPGKDDALVLDLVGVSATMSPVTLTRLLPEADAVRIGLDGEAREEPEPAPEPAPRVRREGAVDMVPFDLLAADEVVAETLWLRTRAGVPFITSPDLVVFLWPHGAGLHRVGWVNLRGPKRGDWITAPVREDAAVAAAHQYMMERTGALPPRRASWRTSRAPSEAQVRFATTLGIPDPESKTRARLSDDISVELTSRRIDPA